MLRLDIRFSIKMIGNYLYSFAGVVRRQRKGGAIGNKLSGELARSKLDIKMDSYFRNVDDTEMILRVLEPGIRLEEGKLVIKEELIEQDKTEHE